MNDVTSFSLRIPTNMTLQSLLQVISQIPDRIKVLGAVYIVVLPSDKPLGATDSDFRNVEVHKFIDGAIHPVDERTVFITTRGKLGTLTKGLLHIADHKPNIEPEEVAQQHVGVVAAHLQSKRTWPDQNSV